MAKITKTYRVHFLGCDEWEDNPMVVNDDGSIRFDLSAVGGKNFDVELDPDVIGSTRESDLTWRALWPLMRECMEGIGYDGPIYATDASNEKADCTVVSYGFSGALFVVTPMIPKHKA